MNSAESSDTRTEARSYQKPAIRPEMTVRQVAADYPPCRDIFVECGEPTDRLGKFGHLQPLTHFARTHRVNLDQLLTRLSQAAGVPIDHWNKSAERIHRIFVLAALGITLTAGAGWGTWLLWRIGVTHNFDAVDPARIVAHGEAQLWGFIGLFIVGISLRTVLINTVRSRMRQFVVMLFFGLGLLSIGGGVAWSLLPNELAIVGIVSATTLLGLSFILWFVQIQALWPKWTMTWARAVMASGLWLTLWAAITLLLRWQAPYTGPESFSMTARLLLIELAVFGFAMNSIYGFGQMLLPGLLRTGRTRAWAIEAAFWLHNFGTAIVLFTNTGIVPDTLSIMGITLITFGTISYAIGQNLFIGKQRNSSRSEQGLHLLDLYIPLAFSWLILSMLALVGGDSFSLLFPGILPQAFAGAVRHALTVGFMTTLILGVGQRLLPVLEHRILWLSILIAPILLLIALGNLLRVTLELLTIWHPLAYSWMPASAIIEWSALLLFAISICSLFWCKDPFIRTGRVTAQSSLAVLLAENPWIEDYLIRNGSTYLARARAVPQELAIGTFAESEGLSASETVALLNNLLSSSSYFDEASITSSD